MANEYFQPGSVPAPNSPGASAVMRNEFGSVGAAFDKLPVMAGHPNEIVVVNASGTALVTSGAALGDYVTKDGVFTLTNKTIAWADNTFPGFGTGATKNAGLLADNVLLLAESGRLPVIDGSNLTGLTAGMVSGVVQILQGGTGSDNLAGAQQNLGIDLKAPIFNPVFTGAPSAPTPPTGDTSSRLATTWFVTNTINAIGAVTVGSDLPLMDGVANAGNLALFAASRQDHVHPSDTSRAPASAGTAVGTSFAPAGGIGATNVQTAIQELDTEKAALFSPTFTGVPLAPTVADPSDTTDKIATTAWVQTRLVQIPVGVQLSNSNAQNLGTNPAPGVGVEASRWDHVHAFPIASQLPNVPNGNITGTNVQWALNELDALKSNNGHTHLAADVTNLTAALVPFSPVSSITATNVQAAVVEMIDETVPRVAGGTGAAAMPTGTTAERPSAVEGYFRRNSEIGQWEGYTGSSWVAVGQGNAASTPFTPAGNIAATNVQAALQEVDAEKVPYGYLSATNTPFTPYGNIAATNVQAAIQELDTETQAGLATKVAKSGDTMSGTLHFAYDAGVVITGGSNKEFPLIWETLPGNAVNTLMARLGLYHTTSHQWAGASVDFTRGNGANDGHLTFRTGNPERTLNLQGDNATFTYPNLVANGATFNGTVVCPSNISLLGAGSTGANLYLYGLNSITGSLCGVHVAGVYLGARINVQGMAGGYYEFKSDGIATAPVSWSPASDERLKENIVPIDGALTKLSGFDGCYFTRKDVEPDRQRAGFIAQRVAEHLPEAVGGAVRSDKVMEAYGIMEGEVMLNIDPTAILALAVQAIKELKAEVDDLRSQLATKL